MAMNLRLTDELNERLRSQAAAEHVSVQVLVIKAVEDYLARNTKRALIDSAMDDVMVSFGDALRRLGE
jgi:predicted transcriptional regulator